MKEAILFEIEFNTHDFNAAWRDYGIDHLTSKIRRGLPASELYVVYVTLFKYKFPNLFEARISDNGQASSQDGSRGCILCGTYNATVDGKQKNKMYRCMNINAKKAVWNSIRFTCRT